MYSNLWQKCLKNEDWQAGEVTVWSVAIVTKFGAECCDVFYKPSYNNYIVVIQITKERKWQVSEQQYANGDGDGCV